MVNKDEYIYTDLFMMILRIEILLFMPKFCPRTTDAFQKGLVRLKLYSLHKNTK